MTGSNSVSLEETEGPKRKLELRGSGMPHQNTAWKGQLKTTTTWYPGAVEATQQVLGPIESESDWQGSWHLTMLLRTPCLFTNAGSPIAVVQPYILHEICERIFREGRRLRVIWAATDTSNVLRQIVREGRCVEFEFNYQRLEDLEWKFKFEWAGRGVQQQKAVALRQDPLVSAYQRMVAVVANVTDAATKSKMQQINASIKRSASRLTLGQLERIAKAPTEIVESFNRQLTAQANNLKQIVGVADKFRQMPYSVANSFVNTARNIVYMSNQTMDNLSRRPAEANALSRNVADITRTAKFFGKSYEAQRLVAREAAALAQAAQAQTPARGAHGEAIAIQLCTSTRTDTVLAVHVVRQGETPFSISQKYYGNPDNAALILKANRLAATSVRLPAGKLLVIPTIGSGTSAHG